jgi:hydroxymethylbilane synthase
MFFRVGTRGSKLALKQTEIFLNSIAKKFQEIGKDTPRFEIKVIKTKGDKILDSPLSRIPGKGFFVKEIEDELIEGKIDFAVHSLKDVTTTLPPQLTISAYLERENPADVLLGLSREEIRDRLKKGYEVKIGTSSLRREFQIKRIFGNKVQVIPIRGNLDTRIRKLENGECDALIVSLAGVTRMKFDGFIKEVLPPQEFLYSPGQGIIAVETRIGSDAEKISQLVNDKKSEFVGMIEREIVKNIGGGCNSPFGICTELKEVEKENDGNKENKIFVLYLKFEAFERNIIFEDEFKITSLDKEQIYDIVSDILSRLKR